MPNTLLQPTERVLSTLNADGSRRWMKPRLSIGRFFKARRAVAYALMAFFILLPHFKINAKQPLLLDIIHREFVFFGKTFLPTDTLLLAILMITIFVSIFLLTALFGRVWCGWACPQTVYMEFLFRPIERLFEGKPGRRTPVKAKGLRRVAKLAVYLVLSFVLANTFLSYFVGMDNLKHWVFASPVNHPIPFFVVLFVTGLMMFDFGFFREQMCVVVCPYARFQSALLDKSSLIIGYDTNRGEPRGKPTRTKDDNGDVHLSVVGDCIDCRMCVTTCPTGIDIRDGLQLECIGCAQCVDACNSVMDKLGRARGLIRYSSESAIQTGKKRLFRPRVIIYPLFLLALVTAFVVVLSGKSTFDALVVRSEGLAYNTLPTGQITNQVRLRLTNRTESDHLYAVEAVSPAGVALNMDRNPIDVGAGETVAERVLVMIPPETFDAGRRVPLRLRITADAGPDGGEPVTREVTYTLLGPSRSAP